MAQEVATLGGGCFWCLEAVYDDLRGVTDVVSGYTGGHVNNPTYQQVCSGTTGHAEVVRVTFDNSVISYRQVLDVFFAIHDPTTLNRQGNDIGTQYRSAIYVHDDAQRATAQQALQDARAHWSNPIVTEITDAPIFYPAEDYHQEYFANNPNAGYCQVVVAPKVAKFRKQFMAQLKK